MLLLFAVDQDRESERSEVVHFFQFSPLTSIRRPQKYGTYQKIQIESKKLEGNH